MAYFSCAKAALTGTDKATRASIAKRLISPTFTNSSGGQTPRGVVQLDVISGNNLSYLKGVVPLKQKRQINPVELYQGSTGTIQTTNTTAIPFKTLGIIGAIGIVVILVLKK